MLFYGMTNRCNMCSEIYFSASPLYMFRAVHTPIIRSTGLTVSTVIGTIIAVIARIEIKYVASVGHSIEYYDARNNKYKINRLCSFGHVQRMEENKIPKRVLYMNLGTRFRGRPGNRWQDEVREDRRIVGGEGWQVKVHNGEECKKLLRMAMYHHILHNPME